MTTLNEGNLTEMAQLYKAMRPEYSYDASVFNPEPQKVRMTKWIIETKLDEDDRILIRLYAELGSVRKLGEKLGISKASAFKEIKRIKRIILDEYAKL